MKISHLVALGALLAVSSTAFADGEAAFKKAGCVFCHAATSTSVGPSLAAIADKYEGDAGAQARLETKVRNGGSGSFGGMPMPATPQSVSPSDIKSIVRWILAR